MKKSSSLIWKSLLSTGVAAAVFAVALQAQAPAPAPAPAGAPRAGGGGRGGAQNQVPQPQHVEAMMKALPDKAPAKPKSPRKVLVLAKACGFVHSSIPLAARTIEELGKKTGAWTTDITYDSAVITEDNLKKYDAVFLASTTGAFLDDVTGDQGISEARRKALLDFVRNGKGLGGIHAATDSYHGQGFGCGAGAGGGGGAARAGAGRAGGPGAPGAGGPGAAGAPGGTARGPGGAPTAAAAAAPSAPRPGCQAGAANSPRLQGRGGPYVKPALAMPNPTYKSQWPEFNKMIGGWFKYHWSNGTLINVKIDDTKSPLTKMFNGKEFVVCDETYTFAMDSYSRENVRVLTSVNYDKMAEEDKADEPKATIRTDGDYALSYIKREGNGRVFVEVLGHDESIYAMKPMLEHILAGMQYALGDLKADDKPSVKPKK